MKWIRVWCKIISQIGKNNKLKIMGVIFVFYNPFGNLAFKKVIKISSKKPFYLQIRYKLITSYRWKVDGDI